MDDYENDTPEQEAVEQGDQSPFQSQFGAKIESTNMAEDMDEEKLTEIGKECRRGFESDFVTCETWHKQLEEWTKLAKQIADKKTFPWPGASNVKYPLLSTASMQFAARAYPSLVPSDGRVVKARVNGKDIDGTKTKIAEAVSIYMSYQLFEEMTGWEEEMDRLLIMLPVVGTMFKKTYWDPIEEVNCSRIVLPKNLIVNYWARSLDTAERISEILEINPRIMKERQQAGIWLEDVDLGAPSLSESVHEEELDFGPAESDDATPYIFIEQHTYLDLDDDGYKEPYIVTFHKATSKVVRIVARYDDKTTFFDDKGKLSKIKPIQYYTKFGFVPNPDGGFYDIGFGVLLGPLNESVNTLINQLVDAGTLNNLQSGFIGKGLRLRMGETRFGPGEWKVVNSTGDDLKKQIVPMPSKEPSKVLYELMTALITSGKELASVAEIFVGKMPGQNTPATTTMATIEQGMKVFTAVYKRIYRALGEEFNKLYRLNGIYVNPNTYVDVVGMGIGPEMFHDDAHKIFPGADPTAVSQTEKLMKAQGLMELLGAGMPLDPLKVLIRVLEAQEQPNWQELIPQQVLATGQVPPKPDPKMLEMQARVQAIQSKAQTDMVSAQQQAELDRQTAQTQLAMKQQEHEMDMAHKQQDIQLEAQSQVARQKIQEAAQMQQLQQKAVQGQQQVRQSEEVHQQNLHQMKQTGAAKAAAAKQAASSKGTTKK